MDLTNLSRIDQLVSRNQQIHRKTDQYLTN